MKRISRHLWMGSVRDWTLQLASTPYPDYPLWSDVCHWYEEGYTPREVALKWVEICHQGVNS